MWLWPDLVNLPCCCWSTLWQPRPLSDASLAWSWCPASKSDTTARTFCTDFEWFFQFFLHNSFYFVNRSICIFFCFSAQQKFWTLWLTNNGRLYPWKKGILITAFGQDDNFDITLFILWRHNLISTVLLQLTVGFRLGLLHQQSQGAHCLACTARSSPHKNSLSHFSCLHSALGNKGKEVINTIKRTNAAIILFKSYIIWPIILIVTVLNWSLHSKKADICVWKG